MLNWILDHFRHNMEQNSFYCEKKVTNAKTIDDGYINT